MIKYAITGKYEGVVNAVFDANGVLRMLDLTNATLDDKQTQYFWINMAMHKQHLQNFLTTARLQAQEAFEKVTFAQFYEAYNVKEGKKRAEAVWSRLSAADQVKAYNYIPVIRSKKQISGQAMPHPVTYLNQQRWND